MENQTDEQLYDRFVRKKDEEAFGILFERYKHPLADFICRIIHNADDAEELMMDAFSVVAAAKTVYKGRSGASFKTWLFAIAGKQAAMFLRKNHTGRETSVFLEDDAAIPGNIECGIGNSVKDPASIIHDNDVKEALYRALDRLDTDQREALYLAYFEDMDAKQISTVLGRSVKQVYNLTARGKIKLKTILEREGYTWDM